MMNSFVKDDEFSIQNDEFRASSGQFQSTWCGFYNKSDDFMPNMTLLY